VHGSCLLPSLYFCHNPLMLQLLRLPLSPLPFLPLLLILKPIVFHLHNWILGWNMRPCAFSMPPADTCCTSDETIDSGAIGGDVCITSSAAASSVSDELPSLMMIVSIVTVFRMSPPSSPRLHFLHCHVHHLRFHWPHLLLPPHQFSRQLSQYQR
jgi:hypothetical protein